MCENIWLHVFQREFSKSPSQYNDLDKISNYEAVRHGFKIYKQMRCFIQYRILCYYPFFVNNFRRIKDREYLGIDMPIELECFMKNVQEDDEEQSYIANAKFPLNLLKMGFYENNYQMVYERNLKHLNKDTKERFILLN